MSLSESKCWYSNNCLHFFKCAVPLIILKEKNTTTLQLRQVQPSICRFTENTFSLASFASIRT